MGSWGLNEGLIISLNMGYNTGYNMEKKHICDNIRYNSHNIHSMG